MVFDVQTRLDKNLETFNAIEKNIQSNIEKVFAEQAELEKMIQSLFLKAGDSNAMQKKIDKVFEFFNQKQQ